MNYNRKSYYLIYLLYFIINLIYAQDQKLADSLIVQYDLEKFKGNELDLLVKIAQEETNPDKKIEFSELLINKAYIDSSFNFLYKGYLQKGNALQFKGENAKALKSYFKSLNYANRSNHQIGIGSLMISISDTYSIMGDLDNSQSYYNRGIQLLRKLNDSIPIAKALLNRGDYFFNSGKLDSSLVYTSEAEIIFKKQNHQIGLAYSKGNIGMIYAEQGKDGLGEKYINEAISILDGLKDYYPVTVYLTIMADIYSRKGNMNKALSYAERSLTLAKKYGLKKQISDANLKLSKLYELNNNLTKSFEYYKNYIIYRDSVTNIDAVQQMANLRTDFEVQKKQDEIGFLEKEAEINQLKDKKNKTITYATAISAFLFLMIAMGIYRRYRFINKTNKIIQNETEKSEKLLLNILPEETAKELKQNGKVQAKQFGSVTVMFTDFKEFTNISQNLSPEELVKSVDFYFSKFDSIIEKHGLEKIKTIGDAYMCAGGLPFPTIDHADKMIQAAAEIAEFMEISKNRNDENIKSFEVRIGINTGPVVAGVVGTKKFAYDIWGDTVNVASRMESTSLPGKINISETTYELIKDKYECEYRGEISVKNKGMMKMYFVQGPEIESDKTKLVKQKSEL